MLQPPGYDYAIFYYFRGIKEFLERMSGIEKVRKRRDTKSPVARYRIYLQLEKSLQPNTLNAYLSDVDKLAQFAGGYDRLPHLNINDLREFLASLVDIGITPRSQARILSSLRSLYGFLKIDGFIENNPTELLDSPKMAMHLPEVLTLQVSLL